MIAGIAVLSFISLFMLLLALLRPGRSPGSLVSERIQKQFMRGMDPAGAKSPVLIEKKNKLSDVKPLDHALRKVRQSLKLQSWIRQSGLPISAGIVILAALFLGSATSLFLMAGKLNSIISLVVSSCVMFLPFGYIAMKRAKRVKTFSDAFPDSIARMSSALRAGFSLQMAFEAVTEDAPSVIVETFREVLAEMEVGQSFEEALKKMLERIDTPELRLFISSVIIQRESGGNLAELLDNLEATIRERFELQRELSAATAQARLSGFILSLLPLFVGGIVFLISKPYMMTLFNDPVGQKLLTAAVCLQLLGFVVIYKIVNIKI